MINICNKSITKIAMTTILCLNFSLNISYASAQQSTSIDDESVSEKNTDALINALKQKQDEENELEKQNQQMKQDFNTFIKNKNATIDDYNTILLKYPKMAETITNAWNILNADKQQRLQEGNKNIFEDVGQTSNNPNANTASLENFQTSPKFNIDTATAYQLQRMFDAYKKGELPEDVKLNYEQSIERGIYPKPEGYDNYKNRPAFTPLQLQQMFNAYKSGKLSERVKAGYEGAIARGEIPKPDGYDEYVWQENVRASSLSAERLQKMFESYKRNEMSDDAKREYEQFIAQKIYPKPDGYDAYQQQILKLAKLEAQKKFDVSNQENMLERVMNIFTGKDRETPETNQANDFLVMPEMLSFSANSIGVLISAFIFKPHKIVEVMQLKFPNIEVSQDSKNNYLIKSGIDSKMYAIKPGLQLSDTVKLIVGLLVILACLFA